MYINNFLETSISKLRYNKAVKKELDKKGHDYCYFDGWYYYYYDTLAIRRSVEGLPFSCRFKSFAYECFYWLRHGLRGDGNG